MTCGGGSPGLLAAVWLDGLYEEAEFYERLARRAGLLVAADGGARFLLARGLVPHVVVGDFDSLDAAGVAALEAEGVELVRHPVRKDQTDGELAVDEALRRGAGELVLVGAIGALDHTLGHLAILRRLATRGVPARLAAPRLAARVLAAPAAVRLDASPGTRVSLVPLGDAAEVTLDGLDYPLDHGALPADAALGLGNSVAAGATATIIVHAGLVAVLVEDGDERLGMSIAGGG